MVRGSTLPRLVIRSFGFNDAIQGAVKGIESNGLTSYFMNTKRGPAMLVSHPENALPASAGFAKSDKEGNQCSAPVMVHVRKDAALADAAPGKPAAGAK